MDLNWQTENAIREACRAFTRMCTVATTQLKQPAKPTVIVIASDVFDPDIIANRIVDAMAAAEEENKK